MQGDVKNKMGFLAILGIVMGCQIGSGVFFSPMILGPYGVISIYGYLITSIGAVSIAMVFGSLCQVLPHTGGPHAYVNAAFGRVFGFFTGWMYWLVSWISSMALIKLAVGYFATVMDITDPTWILVCEVLVVLLVQFINLKGVTTASTIEFILTLLKVVPIIIVPICGIFYMQWDNIVTSPEIDKQPILLSLNQTVLVTMWGFIGVELATAPAGAVHQPEKTIPRAIVLGTFLVAFLYCFNNLSIMGTVPSQTLLESKIPYAEFAAFLFGEKPWLYSGISLVIALVCLSNFNAWTLGSGQIAMGLAKDDLLPKVFGSINKNEAPHFSITLASVCLILLLLLTSNKSFVQQINLIVDFSVVCFLFVYLLCIIAFFRFMLAGSVKKTVKSAGDKNNIIVNNIYIRPTVMRVLFGVIAALFCILVICNTEIYVLLLALLIPLSGTPVYLWRFWKRRKV